MTFFLISATTGVIVLGVCEVIYRTLHHKKFDWFQAAGTLLIVANAIYAIWWPR